MWGLDVHIFFVFPDMTVTNSYRGLYIMYTYHGIHIIYTVCIYSHVWKQKHFLILVFKKVGPVDNWSVITLAVFHSSHIDIKLQENV